MLFCTKMNDNEEEIEANCNIPTAQTPPVLIKRVTRSKLERLGPDSSRMSGSFDTRRMVLNGLTSYEKRILPGQVRAIFEHCSIRAKYAAIRGSVALRNTRVEEVHFQFFFVFFFVFSLLRLVHQAGI
jgi:hypothetical protein